MLNRSLKGKALKQALLFPTFFCGGGGSYFFLKMPYYHCFLLQKCLKRTKIVNFFSLASLAQFAKISST